VRTTVDLPDSLHRQIVAIARDTSRTFSQTVTELIRQSLESGDAPDVRRSPTTGLPVVHVGRVITTEDVRALEDD